MAKRIGELTRKRVGYNFRRIRKSQGLTLKQCAKKGGVSWSYVAQVERGEKALESKSLEKWAKVFACDISEFMLNPEKPDLSPLDVEIMHVTEQLRSLSIDQVKKLASIIPVVCTP